MPKVTKKRRYVKNYTEESLQLALQDIKNGMPKQRAAIKYGIPRVMLQFRLSENFKKVEHDPNTCLTSEKQNLLESRIIESYKKVFPKRRDDIQASVKAFLDKHPRPNPFKYNLPGEHWYQFFLRRHKTLTNRTPEAVTNASGNVSETDIRKWFENIEHYLNEKDYFNILEDPTRVYNGDETYFTLCPKEDKVIAPRDAKNVYQIEQGPSKTNITVMFTFSAYGVTTPPMIVYAYKRLSKNIAESVPDG
ncbi:hypothetical protein NQ314_013707 [Rhamnusium bicolor]|uniref:HTH psq-type domain-containing protein n=1 Tax=Rhamnusium bicolor TaxID=1586634 RepID=A0AAV8X5S8_9CUCU|nr:hypothetical protein NQ314_013707 [Rhamnusium bicolor]